MFYLFIYKKYNSAQFVFDAHIFSRRKCLLSIAPLSIGPLIDIYIKLKKKIVNSKSHLLFLDYIYIYIYINSLFVGVSQNKNREEQRLLIKVCVKLSH